MGLSHLRNASRELYKALRPFLAALRVNLPDWPDGDQKVGPIPVLPIFDRLIADVSSSPGGTMFFAHLLIPHFPYSVDSECRIHNVGMHPPTARGIRCWRRSTVFLNGLVANNLTAIQLQDGHRNMFTRVGEYPGHTQLLYNNS